MPQRNSQFMRFSRYKCKLNAKFQSEAQLNANRMHPNANNHVELHPVQRVELHQKYITTIALKLSEEFYKKTSKEFYNEHKECLEEPSKACF